MLNRERTERITAGRSGGTSSELRANFERTPSEARVKLERIEFENDIFPEYVPDKFPEYEPDNFPE